VSKRSKNCSSTFEKERELGEKERERERGETRRVVPFDRACKIVCASVSTYEKVREKRRENERKRERERGNMCVSACASMIERELPTLLANIK